jgi:outer membrane protein
MRIFQKRSFLSRLALAAGFGTVGTLGSLSFSAQAQSLSDVYSAARNYDAGFLAAKAQFVATVARADQAKASLLPTINYTSSIGRTLSTNRYINSPTQSRSFGTRQGVMSLSQPIYRPGNYATYQQGQKQLIQADAALDSAEQDLLVRVSAAYFDVLSSRDSLTFVKAQKAAVAEQLAAAKRNFEVGTSTITDTREAQARFDLTIAQEIAAENDLKVKELALSNLAGQPSINPWGFKTAYALPTLKVDEINKWVDDSQQAHPSVRQAQVALDVAMLETEKAKAGHKPTLDASMNVSDTTNSGGTAFGVGDSRLANSSANLLLTVPIFAGFSTQNRIKETAALEEKARIDLENAKRSVAQATRASFLGLVSGLGSVKAFEAAESSSQSALDANKLGYQVGVRINIDVLNAQSQLFQTKRDLAKARYDVLVGQLRLRQANGTLKPEDLDLINALLAK